MEEYRYYQEEQVTIWVSNYFTIRANSKEEADEIAAQNFPLNPCEISDEIVHEGREVLWETEDSVEGAMELYDDNHNLIIKEGE